MRKSFAQKLHPLLSKHGFARPSTHRAAPVTGMHHPSPSHEPLF